nr:reverse transcriptase domain-containing protein [Faecalibaculum rodentium]
MSKEGAVREQILDRSYKPLPAKRTDIPKPDGSMRGLNVPAARDRVVQACLASYLDYRKDFEMSNSSYGFRKNRRCEQAILKGLEFMNDGYDWIVDIDLRKFFDTVDQDRLIRLIDNLFHNRDVTSLTRKFVRAGVMIDGRLVRTERGIPQGGPLSPVLANIYLDQADKELESRGLRFTRYADDMLIYVKSEAANRVMKSFSNYLEKKLKLEVNASKSKVARPDEVKYLGFGFKRNKREWKAIPHEKSIHEFEQKIMKLTKQNWSVSLEERLEKINQVIRDGAIITDANGCIDIRCANWTASSGEESGPSSGSSGKASGKKKRALSGWDVPETRLTHTCVHDRDMSVVQSRS